MNSDSIPLARLRGLKLLGAKSMIAGNHSMLLRRLCRLFLVFGALFAARAEDVLELNGKWAMALDPLGRGEALGWPHAAVGWEEVTVPHDFLTDPRHRFTGRAWYRRAFAIPADPGERVWRLQFATVFQRCRVWLNGAFVGTHEGGYTPFEFVVTPHLRTNQRNFLVVEVDNSIRIRALPGARTGKAANEQMYAWLNYGGILGDVRLVATPLVYIASQIIQVEFDPAGTATATALVRVRNDGRMRQAAEVSVQIGEAWQAAQSVQLEPASERMVELRGVLPATVAAQRWSIETPQLHVARALVRSGGGHHRREDAFGVRQVEVREGRFLLNGVPVRLAGANRARGHPRHGGRDIDATVAEDMQLMRDAGLRFARLQHTAPGRNLLEWADRHGMMLILEVGMWGYNSADQASPELRRQFQAEMRELLALAVNHPSVVGWSLGNEYESWTPEGVAWTRDMAAFVKELDPTRPVTFSALGTALRRLQTDPPGEHAFDHVDFISTNLYFPPAQVPEFLDPVHRRWPSKPVMISEFGMRADRVKHEQERLDHFDAYLTLVRERPWICGLSYWSFNDYASHFPGTGEDGYRRWGLVDEFRRPRPLYEHVRARLLDGGLGKFAP